MGEGGQDTRASQPVWAPPDFHLFNPPQCTCHCLSHRKVLIPARVPQRHPREPCREQGCPDTPVFPKLSYICRNVLSNLRYSGLARPHLKELTCPCVHNAYFHCYEAHSVAQTQRSPAQPCGMCALTGSCTAAQVHFTVLPFSRTYVSTGDRAPHHMLLGHSSQKGGSSKGHSSSWVLDSTQGYLQCPVPG